MRTQSKPGFWLSLLSGLLLTFPLVAIFYLGYRLAALPFPPFNLLDLQTRILPVSVVAKGIDTMVRVIGWFHLSNTSGIAKLAEQSMAVSEFILAGMVVSALFFTFLRFGSRKAALLASRILGVVLGVAIAWASNTIETSSTISPGWRFLCDLRRAIPFKTTDGKGVRASLHRPVVPPYHPSFAG